MVTILPPATDIGTIIGTGLGSGVSQGMQRGSEVGFQRGLLQNALKGLQNLPADTSPGQLAATLMQATAGIPGAERYFQPLYESLSKDIQSRQRANAPAIEAITPQGQGSLVQETRPKNVHQQIQESLGEEFFPAIKPFAGIEKGESLKPQKPLTPPKPIGPEQEARMRGILQKNGITDFNQQNQLIDQQRNYQKDLYNSAKMGFENVQQFQEAKKARDEEFFKESDLLLGEAHGQLSPTEKSIWKELSREYEDLPTPQRFANTEQKYNTLIGNPVIQFRENQRGLPFGSFLRGDEIKHRMDTAKNSVKGHLNLIDKRDDIPDDLKGVIKNQLRDQYFTLMAEKDFGAAQSAYAVYDASPQSLSAIPHAPAPKETAFDTTYLSNPQEREKLTYSLANSLTKIKPDDSLLLLREKALQNNYDDQAFQEALNLALGSGRLKLSDFQANEKDRLSIPQRLDLDSIMEGKRSAWDYFKGKK